MEVNFQPEMIGRDEELKELEAYLEKAIEGEGNTVFVSGEAGIGKTRIVNELGKIAKSRGFQVLTGYSLHESLTPYMPFLDALRSGDLESLFAEEAPRVEAVYLVTHGGVLINDVLREDSDLNPALFASMLTAVGNFVKDSFFQQEGVETQDTLRKLSYGDHEILIERGENIYIVVMLTGGENEFLIEDMREALSKIHRRYSHVLEGWEGDEEDVVGIEEFLRPLITSGKYDGIYYGKEDPKARRNLLFENVSLGLIRQAQKEPTVLCIEDLQWVDPSSLALMHYVARNARRSGLLMLGTYRPEDVAATDGKGHPLIDAMQLMNREDLYERIELRRLPRESLDEFLSSMFGDFDLDDDFKGMIYKETEGNPLFMIELTKLLVEERFVKRDDGTWKLATDLEGVDIPSKVHDVIARRLIRVERKDREILEYASVIGEVFNSKTLADALSVETVQLLERLRILERTHRLIRSSNGTYSFDHAKVKEVLYSEIPAELRAERHRSVAESIEKLNEDDLDEVIGDIAFHYSQSGDKEKAISYLTRAAEKAKEEYSNEEAIRFYSEALELEEDRHKRMEFFEARGDVLRLISEYDKSIESYNSALESAEGSDGARILAKIGGVHGAKGELDESSKICRKALDLIRGEGSKEEAFVLHALGRTCHSKGAYDEALKHLEESLKMSERAEDDRQAAKSLYWIGNTYQTRGDYEKASELLGNCLEAAETIGDQHLIATVENAMGHLDFHRGEYDKALIHYLMSMEICDRIGDRDGISRALSSVGSIHTAKGENEEAMKHQKKALDIAEKTGNQIGVAMALGNVASIYMAKGEYHESLEYTKRGVDILERIGHLEFVAIGNLNIGNAYGNLGEYDKALEYFRRSLELEENLGIQRPMTYTLVGMADTYLRLGDPGKALEFCNRALDLSKKIGYKHGIVFSKTELGRIYGKQRRWEESIGNFDEAIRIAGKMGLEEGVGECYYEFGLMWKDKGDAGKAKKNLEKALDIFESHNADFLAKKVKGALDVLQTTTSHNSLER